MFSNKTFNAMPDGGPKPPPGVMPDGGPKPPPGEVA